MLKLRIFSLQFGWKESLARINPMRPHSYSPNYQLRIIIWISMRKTMICSIKMRIKR
jgi:hypothetical protein